MFEIVQEQERIRFRISSTADNVKRVLQEVRGLLKFSDTKDMARLQLLLRELLTNAWEHGNQGQEERSIVCEVLDLTHGRTTVRVSDEGKGFDYQSLCSPAPLGSSQQPSSGFPLIEALTDELFFNSCGNVVTAICTWKKSPPRILATPNQLPLNTKVPSQPRLKPDISSTLSF